MNSIESISLFKSKTPLTLQSQGILMANLTQLFTRDSHRTIGNISQDFVVIENIRFRIARKS